MKMYRVTLKNVFIVYIYIVCMGYPDRLCGLVARVSGYGSIGP
jgi:hypothetical protein